jgi:hypothetical protein
MTRNNKSWLLVDLCMLYDSKETSTKVHELQCNNRQTIKKRAECKHESQLSWIHTLTIRYFCWMKRKNKQTIEKSINKSQTNETNEPIEYLQSNTYYYHISTCTSRRISLSIDWLNDWKNSQLIVHTSNCQ